MCWCKNAKIFSFFAHLIRACSVQNTKRNFSFTSFMPFPPFLSSLETQSSSGTRKWALFPSSIYSIGLHLRVSKAAAFKPRRRRRKLSAMWQGNCKGFSCFQFDKDFDIEIRLVYSPPCSLFTFLNLKCFPILCLVDETRSEHYDIIFLLGTEMDFWQLSYIFLVA